MPRPAGKRAFDAIPEAFGKLLVIEKVRADALRVATRSTKVISMKRAISVKLLISTAMVALAAAMSSGLTADAGTFGDGITLAEFHGSIAPNRLDIYDERRELAREAEHRRIRTRLGDPGCQTVAVDNRYVYRASQPALVVVVCR